MKYIILKEFSIPLLAQIPMNEKMCESCDTGRMNELLIDPAIKSAFDQLTKSLIKK